MKKFRPFDEMISDKNDFGMNDLSEMLELTRIQRELLFRLLQTFEIIIWFNEKDEHNQGGPRLEIVTFFDGNFVAEVGLARMFDDDDLVGKDIGYTEEIEALDKLKVVLDRAIMIRRDGA